MADVTIRVQSDDPKRTGTFTITKQGVVTRADGRPVTEMHITTVVRTLTGHMGQPELAGRVQGWWWTSGHA